MSHMRLRGAMDRWILTAALAALYLGFRPPLYDADGYRYQLFGRELLPNINPHHLLWNFVQSGLVHAASALHIPSPATCQIFGILMSLAGLFVLHRLLARERAIRSVSAGLVLWIGLSPWFWYMGLQNQPYALLFFLLVLFLDCFARFPDRIPRGGAFFLAAALLVAMIGLQQATVLWIPAASFFFLRQRRPREGAWFAALTLATVGALYWVVGHLKGLSTVPDFRAWTTAYLHTQHSLQFSFPESLVKTVMGWIGTAANQTLLKEWLYDNASPNAVNALYSLLGLALGALLALAYWKFRSRSALDFLCWLLIAAWSFFCLLWEPSNYYWYILMIPLAVILAGQAGRWPTRARHVLVILLAAASGWNLWANHQVDRRDSARAPEPEVRVTEQHMSSKDLFLVLDPGWYRDVDYDLLLWILKVDGSVPVKSLSRDFVAPLGQEGPWQLQLGKTIDGILAGGGRVFLSGWIFEQEPYDQRWSDSPFADFTPELAHPIDWSKLNRQAPAFFHKRYKVEPAGFAVGSDAILELKR